MIRKLTVGLKWTLSILIHVILHQIQRFYRFSHANVNDDHRIFQFGILIYSNSGALCYRIYFRHTGVGNTWEHYRKSRRIWNFLYYFQKKYYYSIEMLGRIYFILLLYACSMNEVGCIKQLAKNQSICITTLNHLQNKFNNHSTQQKNPLWKCTQFPLNHRKTNIVMMKRIQLARVASA